MTKVTNVFIGQILKNKLTNGAVVLVRVMQLNVAGTDMPRVCDMRETLPDAYLIAKSLTWAAPLENLYQDSETQALTEKEFILMSHEHSLIHYKF
jgi:hypothetical protein